MSINQNICIDKELVSYLLTLVKFVARAGRSPSHVDPFSQPSQGTLARAIVGLSLAQDFLEARSQQGTDRSALFGGKYADLSQ